MKCVGCKKEGKDRLCSECREKIRNIKKDKRQSKINKLFKENEGLKSRIKTAVRELEYAEHSIENVTPKEDISETIQEFKKLVIKYDQKAEQLETGGLMRKAYLNKARNTEEAKK